jgi:hypothetical protein
MEESLDGKRWDVQRMRTETYSAIAAQGLYICFVDAFDGSKSGAENRSVVFINAFLDGVWRLMLILLKCGEVKRCFVNSVYV